MDYCVFVLLFCTIFSRDALCKKRGSRKFGDKIVGGYNTTISEYPYQVYLLLQKGSEYYQCGGSILSSRAVLTAAHCLQGIQKTYIRIGSSDSDNSGTQYTSSTFSIHPLYNTRPNDYDVAVITISQAMSLDGRNAKTVRLAEAGSSVPAGTNLAVTGWGATSENGDISSNLMAVEVPTISNAECSKKYRGITARMVCAGANGKDSCQGDSGGPAVSVATGVQLGIVSFGVGCARPGYPGVYTSVSAVRTWIKSVSGV